MMQAAGPVIAVTMMTMVIGIATASTIELAAASTALGRGGSPNPAPRTA